MPTLISSIHQTSEMLKRVLAPSCFNSDPLSRLTEERAVTTDSVCMGLLWIITSSMLICPHASLCWCHCIDYSSAFNRICRGLGLGCLNIIFEWVINNCYLIDGRVCPFLQNSVVEFWLGLHWIYIGQFGENQHFKNIGYEQYISFLISGNFYSFHAVHSYL